MKIDFSEAREKCCILCPRQKRTESELKEAQCIEKQ